MYRRDVLAEAPPAILPLLADPHRWRLLAELARSDRRVGELTARLDVPQNLVSYHLRELRDAGVVTSRRSSADGRDVYYRADLVRCRDLLAAAGGGVHPALALMARDGAEASATRRARRVLFLCTGNSARSQMAEAIAAHRSGGLVEARSAGSNPKPLHAAAVRVLAERGIDIAGREPKHLQRFTRTRVDRVITLCDKVREVCPDVPGHPEASHWSMPDPAAEVDAATTAPFVRTADELEERIDLLLLDLAVRPERSHQ